MIFESVQEIIANAMGARLKVDKSEINENTEFIADLHADSVDVATIICDIEDEFNIEIDEEELEGIETVGDVVERIEAMI